jgi:hypothetical protein
MSNAREQQGDATNPEQPTIQELHARHKKSGGLRLRSNLWKVAEMATETGRLRSTSSQQEIDLSFLYRYTRAQDLSDGVIGAEEGQSNKPYRGGETYGESRLTHAVRHPRRIQCVA